MPNINEGIKSLLLFLSRQTWKKVLIQFFVSLLVISTWAVLQFGDEIAAYVKHTSVHRDDTTILTDDRIPNSTLILKSLNKKTIDELNALTGRLDIIAGTSVVIVDFQGNNRYVVYLNSPNKDLNAQFTQYALQGTEQPFFTENVEQNQRYVELIDGGFVCIPYPHSNLAAEMPGTTKYVDTLCGMGIPPVYGKFVGIVGIFLKRAPTPAELDQLRIIAKNMSNVVYNKELR